MATQGNLDTARTNIVTERIGMVDWEFWGSKEAWMAIGAGSLMIILGIVLWGFEIIQGLALAVIGAAILVGVGYYLAYWENWSLFGKRKGV